MNLYELDFVCAYTIYEVQGDILLKIVDHGTSGNSPMFYDLSDPSVQEYASVSVALNPSGGTKYDNPYPGRTVVSYPMKMLYDIIWVWNFHFDESNDKALSLTLSNDIVEIREVYRSIHAFCLLLQKDMIQGSGKEIVPSLYSSNVQAQRS
jgi:hypothetical protein